jgi:hypothetical protein
MIAPRYDPARHKSTGSFQAGFAGPGKWLHRNGLFASSQAWHEAASRTCDVADSSKHTTPRKRSMIAWRRWLGTSPSNWPAVFCGRRQGGSSITRLASSTIGLHISIPRLRTLECSRSCTPMRAAGAAFLSIDDRDTFPLQSARQIAPFRFSHSRFCVARFLFLKRIVGCQNVLRWWQSIQPNQKL